MAPGHAEPPPPPEPEGCFADLKAAWREGKFKSYARWGGVLNVTVCVFLAFMFLATNGVIPSLLLILTACLIGILELPFCCTCLQVCRAIQPYMTIFEVYWIRGVFYIGLGVLQCVIFGGMGGFLNLIFGIAFILDGALYCLAHFRGETHTAADNKVDGLGLGSGNQVLLSRALGVACTSPPPRTICSPSNSGCICSTHAAQSQDCHHRNGSRLGRQSGCPCDAEKSVKILALGQGLAA